MVFYYNPVKAHHTIPHDSRLTNHTQSSRSAPYDSLVTRLHSTLQSIPTHMRM